MPLGRWNITQCGCDCGDEPPPVACTMTFTVRGCSSQPLPGAVVTLTTSGFPTTSGTTNSSGQVTLGHGATAGNYSVTHPSGRFTSSSGSFYMCQAGFPSSSTPAVTLSAAAGYSCCLSGTPYPAKLPLTVTPSDGSPFTISSCSGNGCVNVTKPWSANGPTSIICGAYIPTLAPAGIAAGTVDCRVAVSLSGGVSASVTYAASRATYPDGTACGTISPADPQNTIFWYRSGGCSGNVRDAGASVNTIGVVNSYSPLNVTCTFGGSNTPIGSVTVTEAP